MEPDMEKAIQKAAQELVLRCCGALLLALLFVDSSVYLYWGKLPFWFDFGRLLCWRRSSGVFHSSMLSIWLVPSIFSTFHGDISPLFLAGLSSFVSPLAILLL